MARVPSEQGTKWLHKPVSRKEPLSPIRDIVLVGATPEYDIVLR